MRPRRQRRRAAARRPDRARYRLRRRSRRRAAGAVGRRRHRARSGAESIAVARAHAEATGAPFAYRAGLVEDLVAEGARFDVVTALEVVEHVADLRAFVAAAAALAKPGGLMLLSTLNRTLKSFALAIVGAEHVLGWVEKGTHRWEQFVTPDELAAALAAAGCRETARRGVVYDLPRRDWRLSSDVSVNYFLAAKKI